MEIEKDRWTEWEHEIHTEQKSLLNEYKMALIIGNLKRMDELKKALENLNRKKIEVLTERGRMNVQHAVDSIGYKRLAWPNSDSAKVWL